jgi:hypothetical protein
MGKHGDPIIIPNHLICFHLCNDDAKQMIAVDMDHAQQGRKGLLSHQENKLYKMTLQRIRLFLWHLSQSGARRASARIHIWRQGCVHHLETDTPITYNCCLLGIPFFSRSFFYLIFICRGSN